MKMPLPSRIAIIGPGAIGSLFAAVLARAQHDVFLLDRNPTRAAQRNAAGIRVQELAGAWEVTARSSTCAADFGIADIVLICTKAYDTASAVALLPPLMGHDTIVLSLQNGVGNADLISAVAPRHCVCASTAMGARIDTAGTLCWTGQGITQLAPFEGTARSDAEAVGRILTAAHCGVEILSSAPGMLWAKLIINAAINPVTAIHGITNGALLLHPEARKQAFAAAQEAGHVADAMGITRASKDVIGCVTEVCKGTATNRSSMLQDIERGTPTEIDAITGAVIREAERHHVAVPVNRILYRAVQEL